MSTETVDVILFTNPQRCLPCREVEKSGVIEDIRSAGYSVEIVNSDTNQAMTTEYGIMGIPTWIIRRGGIPARKLIGARDKSTMLAELKLAEG